MRRKSKRGREGDHSSKFPLRWRKGRRRKRGKGLVPLYSDPTGHSVYTWAGRLVSPAKTCTHKRRIKNKDFEQTLILMEQNLFRQTARRSASPILQPKVGQTFSSSAAMCQRELEWKLGGPKEEEGRGRPLVHSVRAGGHILHCHPFSC